jgi:dephospho-CoA kinase
VYDIGLMGPARSGKDTAAAHLVAHYGYKRVAFADPVRASMLALDPIVEADGDDYGVEVVRLSEMVRDYGWERAKDECPEVRRLLQAYASEAVRDVVGANVWLNLGLAALAHNRERHTDTVITDVRFPNEVAALRERCVRLVYVHRPGTAPANGHVSERAVGPDDADIVIVNDGTVADLLRAIEGVVNTVESEQS